jgi:Ni,Fe-hydrogenase I cytochrome b subunit
LLNKGGKNSQGMDSWWYDIFAGWLIPLFGQSQDVHTWHHLGMWFILTFVMVHVYAGAQHIFLAPSLKKHTNAIHDILPATKFC